MTAFDLAHLPSGPGVYRFYTAADAAGEEELLYVGKAINLQKRIKSYFQKSTTLSPRINLMVQKIGGIEFTVTENEISALILENNLIKSLKPRYNIIFRDDKTYPMLRVTHHQFPRLDSYRGKVMQNGDYFGPYPNVQAMKYSLDLIQRIFKLRTCSDNMFKSRTRPCMLYQIKRCTAPCVNLVSQEEYARQVKLAIDFLEGKYSQITRDLKAEMMRAADNLEFERAGKIRDKISMINSISANQIINTYQKPLTADLVIMMGHGKKAFIYLIMLRAGIYVGDNNFIVDNPDDDLSEVLQVFLESHYLPREQQNLLQIFSKCELSRDALVFLSRALKIKISHQLPQQLNKLYAMGENNLRRLIADHHREDNLPASASRLAHLLASCVKSSDLRVDIGVLNVVQLQRIECIDVSHHMGENTVASVVVYANGTIDHSQYRRYNLNQDLMGNPINGNDLRAMETVVLKGLASTTKPMPDLIVVDGGKLQLNAIKNILKDQGLYGKIRVVALFKGLRRDPMRDSVLLDTGLMFRVKDEPLIFELLHQLRDEAHRFAITAHRKKQVNKMSGSVLDEIPGIGPKIRRKLLLHFGSVKNIAHASVSDLQQVDGVGQSLANEVAAYLQGST